MPQQHLTTIDEIGESFDALDPVYVLLLEDEAGQGLALGAEGLFAMHLIGNCLYEEATGGSYTDSGAWAPKEQRKRTRAGNSRRKKVERLVERLRESGVEFALCYHVDDDPGWYMAWSDSLTREEAMNRVYQHMGHCTTDISKWCP